MNDIEKELEFSKMPLPFFIKIESANFGIINGTVIKYENNRIKVEYSWIDEFVNSWFSIYHLNDLIFGIMKVSCRIDSGRMPRRIKKIFKDNVIGRKR